MSGPLPSWTASPPFPPAKPVPQFSRVEGVEWCVVHHAIKTWPIGGKTCVESDSQWRQSTRVTPEPCRFVPLYIEVPA